MQAAAIEDVTGSCAQERTPAVESKMIAGSGIRSDHRQWNPGRSPAVESGANAGSGIQNKPKN